MATINGFEVEVADLAGDPDRRALVLLHEGLGSVGLWRGFPAALAGATGRRVIAFSRLGHGRSDPPPRPRTPDFFHGGGARRAARAAARSWGIAGAAARRPQRRRLDRARPRRRTTPSKGWR